MSSPRADRLAAGAFVLSIAVLCVAYGALAALRGWFPARQIALAHETVLDLAEHWRNDLGLVPTRHLVSAGPDPDPDRGYRRTPDAVPTPGHVLISGSLGNFSETLHVVRMFDRDGHQVHEWPIHYDLLDREMNPRNVLLHGLEVFEDGSIAVAFDHGNAIARIDACGAPVWTVNGNYHHSITRDDDGAIVTWRDEAIVRLDAATGEELLVLDVPRDLVPADRGAQSAYLQLRTERLEVSGDSIRYLDDPFHPNDAETLRAGMADAFPMFAAGDILFSLREINLVAVVDPANARLKWWHHGPWIRQHDPDFQPDGTITVFDNATGTGRSMIRRIDPADDSLSVVFDGGKDLPFFSWRRGKHQVLPGGNLLLTEAERGRVLEVDPEGHLVWERHLPWDATRNRIVTEARHLPETYFRAGQPSCPSRDAGPSGSDAG
ncbi:arylsulfotransferase family protein [Maritimibacter sp. HL-12]|uniref:arylsulfotransferase family protein n=1 Tax=Maritimibacter sp. HL-12 TaxID=1162418 RepID=UPI000A0F2F5A|nr:arylsulfotransferase family protein [Maritimibacter sp. HL-12]SMH53331.1 Arylsulfotransferase (ASST) [Maritimibacter sp. HL-12]